jgi:hypothetical protein
MHAAAIDIASVAIARSLAIRHRHFRHWFALTDESHLPVACTQQMLDPGGSGHAIVVGHVSVVPLHVTSH